jgi:hypothetical protein
MKNEAGNKIKNFKWNLNVYLLNKIVGIIKAAVIFYMEN